MTVEKRTTRVIRRVHIVMAMACAIVMTALLPAVSAYAAETNLALNKPAQADSVEVERFNASKAFDGDTTSPDSRWATRASANASQEGGPHWIYVDLGSEQSVSSVKITWEQRKANGYKIQVATGDAAPAVDSADWKTVYTNPGRPANLVDQIQLTEATKARFVRLYIDHNTYNDPDNGVAWGTVSIFEMEVFGTAGSEAGQNPEANIALGSAARADSVEVARFSAAKAVDGDTSSSGSRWASSVDASPERDGGPHWIYLDFGQERDVKTIRIFWEQRKAKGYKVQLASGNAAPEVNSADWKTVFSNDGHPATLTETIKLGEVQKARFMRLYIDHNTHADPDDGTAWGNVSLYEIEAYGGTPAESLEDVAAAISVATPAKGATKLDVTLPESEHFEAAYNGTDYEQVVDRDLNIHQPLVDTTVKVSFKVKSKADPSKYAFREIQVTVPGAYQQEEGDNIAPAILPELREWKGGSGVFKATSSTRVLYADASFKAAAEALAADYEDLFGTKLTVAQGTSAGVGDIVLAAADASNPGLGDEGYYMEIADGITVKAGGKQGAYWSTRTILQALKLSGDGTIAQGKTRDYPLYKVRGLILDVGRKTFSLDFLKQMVKELSWFKLNDFQVHLNDNYIWVEQYTNETVDQAYSGFRLESDIKAGGNNGLNKADLTSKDMWYSKDDFRAFIKESRELGVNIVPEFDMPAHSLAFTKVRPDLRTPTSMTHRGNDHLNIATKYDESLAFALSVWDEYTTGANPVFDTETTLHIGADEFEADGNAYRRFVNDLFKYVEDSGRTARVWGSLTQIKGDGTVAVSGISKTGKRREINLWSSGWANMKEMYNLGFDLINSNDGTYYMVPNAGYYSDYLNANTVYNSAINSIAGTTIPAGDEQMVGGSFAVWNDMTDRRENGMSEYDIYDRIRSSAGLYSAASWGKGSMTLAQAKDAASKLGDAPNTNFGYLVEKNEDGVAAHYKMNDLTDAAGVADDLKLENGAKIAEVDGKKALELTEGATATTGLGTVGLGNDLRVKVKRMSASSDEQILFESEYGAIKAVQKGTGQVGFSREGRDYSFNYTLPVGEWVELEFKNAKDFTTLWVNGSKVETLGVAGVGKLKATSMYPVERIGAAERGFVGFVDDLRITTDAQFSSTMPLDAAVIKASAILENLDDQKLSGLVKDAEAIIESVNPDAAAIQAAVDAINARIAELDFKKADYSQVDALLAAVPKDLAHFTDESVAVLDAAVDGVVRDLPVGMQDQVDAYRDRIKAAISGLALKSDDETFARIASVTASSQETASENTPATAAIDGDTATFWHTRWSSNADNGPTHWIDLKLEEPATVDGLAYTPRVTGTNGRIQEYRVEVSTDGGKTYQKVAEGAFADPSVPSTVSFDEVDGVTNVRLVSTKSMGQNKFASAAEVRVRTVESSMDLDRLRALIEQVKGLDKDDYTPETWTALADALKTAETAAGAEEPVADDVTAALDGLTAALLKLEPAAIEKPVDPDPKPVEHTVSFVVDGSVVSIVKVKDGETVAKPVDPVKEGCTFKYWTATRTAAFRSAPAAYDFATPVTGDLTLTAVFEKEEQGDSGKTDAGSRNGKTKPGKNRRKAGLPKTGDASLALVAAGALVSVGALGAAAALRRRRG
ncbi:MAG: LPXTG cell wall anchor domain-containing protein [Coriobacteriaceae bacterium]|nr:LPXTG cell wall anchor domain-containing protein [Coriobacteriaceae bacterium]